VTGLSFDLTEEQEQLRQAVRDFAERECARRTWLERSGKASGVAELAAGSVAEAPRMSRPAAQAESA